MAEGELTEAVVTEVGMCGTPGCTRPDFHDGGRRGIVALGEAPPQKDTPSTLCTSARVKVHARLSSAHVATYKCSAPQRSCASLLWRLASSRKWSLVAAPTSSRQAPQRVAPLCWPARPLLRWRCCHNARWPIQSKRSRLVRTLWLRLSALPLRRCVHTSYPAQAQQHVEATHTWRTAICTAIRARRMGA